VSLDTLRNSIHPDDRLALVRGIREAASTGRPIDGEFRVVMASGETRWIAMKGYPRRNKNVGSYHINGILSDVTAVKNSEGEAELQRTEIARLMRQSVLGELPLTAILSNAETAQDLLGRSQIDREMMQEIVSDIIEEDNRASEVISRIRKLLRKGQRESESIDLNQLVESTLSLLRGEFVRRKTDVHVELAPNLPGISGDPIQLQQVLLNVIMNAMEAVGSQAPSAREIKITTRVNGKQVEAAIVDSGHGIAAEDQKVLFEPFFTTKERGLGLGLSICFTIVKSHGGKLSIDNEPGGGAKVVVTLPVQDTLVPA
jgi:signal transduction histidine kinase